MKNDLRLNYLVQLQTAILIILLTMILAAGCSSTPSSSQDFVYLPPTPAVSRQPPLASPTPLPTPRPSPTLTCSDNLSFVQDLTIPDGYLARPGEALDKRWEVENSGTCNWNHRYQLRLISGDRLGAETRQSLFPARSGTQVTLRIFFTAPEQPGVYRGAWQAFDPQENVFGDPIFIEIAVTEDQEP